MSEVRRHLPLLQRPLLPNCSAIYAGKGMQRKRRTALQRVLNLHMRRQHEPEKDGEPWLSERA